MVVTGRETRCQYQVQNGTNKRKTTIINWSSRTNVCTNMNPKGIDDAKGINVM